MKSWTVIFNVLVGIGIVIAAIVPGGFVPDKTTVEIAGIVIAIINLYLRLRPLPPTSEHLR